ncbi:MAG: right-handed parallel beta-helix repeat-containing protein [Candidatus Hodarchaeota archaeon]
MNTKSEYQIEKKLKSSAYWNLTGSPIDIDDSDPLKNWATTAATYNWCSGSGTFLDPYLIENVIIDGQGSGSCITIRNSITLFKIRNCTLYNSGSNSDSDGGIKLESVDYGEIRENNCSNNKGNGIFLSNSWNIGIFKNIVNNNTYSGIRVRWRGLHRISNNIAKYNYDGIDIFLASSNYVSNNIVKYNYEGILISGGGGNTVLNNIATNNSGNGLYVGGSVENRFIDNTACNNTGSGIYISEGNENEFRGNTIDNNKNFGIYIYLSINCTVSENDIRYNDYGIKLERDGIHTVSENNISYNIRYGLHSLNSNRNNINSNILDNNQRGIYLQNSDNTYISDNSLANNFYGLYLDRSNYNDIFNNDVCDNNLSLHEGEDCEGNIFRKNDCIDDTFPPGPPPEIIIIIVICIAGAMITVGMVIYKRKSSRKEIVSKKLLSSYKLKKEIRKTEAEVSVEKEFHVCVVHRGRIVGAVYICPECETYYCMKCAITLKEKGETCWVCKKEIEL